MSNDSPGNPLAPEPMYYLAHFFTNLDSLGHTLSAYALKKSASGQSFVTYEDCIASFRKGWDRAVAESQQVPDDHSAYSSKLDAGHARIMASHGLPLH